MENQQFASAKDSKNLALFLGVAFILTGLLFNKWSIESITTYATDMITESIKKAQAQILANFPQKYLRRLLARS